MLLSDIICWWIAILRNANLEGVSDVARAQLRRYGWGRSDDSREARKRWNACELWKWERVGALLTPGADRNRVIVDQQCRWNKKRKRSECFDMHADRHGAFDNFTVKQLGRVNHGTCVVLKLFRAIVRSDKRTFSKILYAEYLTHVIK